MLLDQGVERASRPSRIQGIERRDGVGRITPIHKYPNRTECLSGPDKAQDHLFTVTPALHNFYAAFQDHMGVFGRVPLGENSRSAREVHDPGLLRDLR